VSILPEKSRGINVQEAMAFLFSALSGRYPQPPPGPVSSDPGFFAGGSPNMKGLYAVTHWIYALFGGTALAGSLGVARARVLAFLRKLPHGLGEPTTATHGQLWAALVSAAIWAAWKAGDWEILDAAIAWKAAEYQLWKPCRVEGLVVDYWMPGARARDANGLTGSNFARTFEGEIIRAYDPATKSWLKGRLRVPKNKSYTGPLALLACPGEIVGRVQTAPAIQPPLYRPFHVRRWASGDFLAWYGPGLPIAGPGDSPAHAAGVLNGLKWIEGEGSPEIMEKHRYPSVEPDLVLDVEGVP
jgi:hypothetical protein